MTTGRRILTLQQRAREVGRIRMGEKREKTRDDGSTVTYPARLDFFRFTSHSREAIELAAARYGGTVREWEGQWEVITQAAQLPVAVPHGFDPVSQSYELWDRGGCKRRCDGYHESISDGPCLCDPEERDAPAAPDDVCKPHLRVALLLPEIPILGVWRLETSGYYANTELPAMLMMLQAARHHVRGTLRLEKRTVVRDGRTNTFPVPVIDVSYDIGQLVDGEVAGELDPVGQPDQIQEGAPAPKPSRPEIPAGPDPEPLPPRREEEPPPPPAESEVPDVIDRNQRVHLFARGRELGLNDNDIRAIVAANQEGTTSTAQMTVATYRQVLRDIEAATQREGTA